MGCNTIVWSSYLYQTICLMLAWHQRQYPCLAMGFQGWILFMAAPWVFRVKSCVWLCCGFSRTNPDDCTKYSTMVCTVWALILGMVPNIVLWFGPAPIITLLLGLVPNVFPDSLFINLLCVHAMFKRFVDKEWHNPSGTSSDSRSNPLEQSCLGIGNSKTRTLY